MFALSGPAAPGSDKAPAVGAAPNALGSGSIKALATLVAAGRFLRQLGGAR